jgi:thioester reductase-like protein
MLLNLYIFSCRVNNDIRNTLRKRRIASKSSEFDKLLHEKRPELARRQRRQILYKNANEAAQGLLREKNIDPKAKTLFPKLQNIIPFVKDGIPNDGLLVIYINTKLMKRFGPVKDREPETLLLSQEYMNEVVNELRRMI